MLQVHHFRVGGVPGGLFKVHTNTGGITVTSTVSEPTARQVAYALVLLDRAGFGPVVTDKHFAFFGSIAPDLRPEAFSEGYNIDFLVSSLSRKEVSAVIHVLQIQLGVTPRGPGQPASAGRVNGAKNTEDSSATPPTTPSKALEEPVRHRSAPMPSKRRRGALPAASDDVVHVLHRPAPASTPNMLVDMVVVSVTTNPDGTLVVVFAPKQVGQ